MTRRIVLVIALAIVAITAATARAHTTGGHHAPWLATHDEVFIERAWDKRHTLRRIKANLCRPKPVFARRPGLVHPLWRRHRLDRLNFRIERARGYSSRCTPWYITKQIWAANILGRESLGDPWPNCPDPYDGGGYTWTDTVNCENGGNWLDSPGYYRCGLQFDPGWESRFGRLCP